MLCVYVFFVRKNCEKIGIEINLQHFSFLTETLMCASMYFISFKYRANCVFSFLSVLASSQSHIPFCIQSKHIFLNKQIKLKQTTNNDVQLITVFRFISHLFASLRFTSHMFEFILFFVRNQEEGKRLIPRRNYGSHSGE